MRIESVSGNNGPLFLIGMPRSGTKILREMLNQHPVIRFSDIETDFFPYWVSRWEKLMPSAGADRFDHFYRDCLELPFFVQNADRGVYIDRDSWRQSCAAFTPNAVFEGLMRTCLAIPTADRTIIWGDKSPSYIRHISLLVEQFPNAQILHIVRDVRDYALSMQEAWGKDVIRAAQRWQNDVSAARIAGRKLGDKYLEIRYEDLLARPQPTLERITSILGIDFEPEMLRPTRIVENKGAAKKTSGILQINAEKYRTLMPAQMVARIEKIAGPTLRDFGYPCRYQGKAVRVPGWRMQLGQLHDGWNIIRADVERLGLARSIRYNFKYFRISGNRM